MKIFMSMMCRPKWPFLLMCVFHDVRHVEFRGLTGSQRTPLGFGESHLGIRAKVNGYLGSSVVVELGIRYT